MKKEKVVSGAHNTQHDDDNHDGHHGEVLQLDLFICTYVAIC